jgi:flavin-dependent dehydrogenase
VVPSKTDIFVAGGGPAGLAAAIAARLRGFDVVVSDAAQPPIDKACGEGLMPDSIGALRRLGIAPDPEQSFAFRGIRFIGEGGSVAADFPRFPGIAVRRVRLHQLLIDRAEALGVKLLWRTRVKGLDEIRARWIIGADGTNSLVRRWAGLDAARSQSFRYGFRRHYRVAPWSEFMEIYWADGCQMYVTPVSQEEACVALITRDPHLRVDAALSRFPDLARRLRFAEPAGSERGAITVTRRLRSIYRGQTALIGDASGSVDAITGEGMSLSFRQALVLADSLVSGDLAVYQTAHRRMARRPAIMARLMLLLDRFPRARPHVLRAFAAEPVIFETLLAVHTGA